MHLGVLCTNPLMVGRALKGFLNQPAKSKRSYEQLGNTMRCTTKVHETLKADRSMSGLQIAVLRHEADVNW